MSKTKTTKKSLPAGSSTMKAMNAYVENLTTAGQSKRTVTRTPSSDEPTRNYPKSTKRGKRVGSGYEPITYDGLIRKSDKKAKQVHTRDAVTERIIVLRERVGDLYAKGKFTTSALTAVLTMIDNITFYKCSGEYDRAIDLATDLDSRLSNA